MAKAGSTISAAILLLLIGTAAGSKNAEDGRGGASVATADSLHADSAKALTPDPSRSAQRPHYVPGGWQCPAGLVWRNAGRTDWLCVDPQEARRIERENEQASENWVEGPDGTRTCRSGLVRREAFNGDVACVYPARRATIRQMNLALYSVR